MKFTKIVYIGGNPCREIIVDGTVQHDRVAYYHGDTTRPLPRKADGAKDGDQLYMDDTQNGYTFNERTDLWMPAGGGTPL